MVYFESGRRGLSAFPSCQVVAAQENGRLGVRAGTGPRSIDSAVVTLEKVHSILVVPKP